MSVFAWLDGDDVHRRQMLDVVKLFQDEGSVDELGIGSVRDAFSNAMFPGTSVLHTRARYLLFVPWLVKDTARHGWHLDKSRSELRSREIKLIRSLLAGLESTGVIGNQAQEKLKTMPSAVYWASLGRIGLRRWDVSIDGHFRRTAQGSRLATEVSADDDMTRRSDLGLHPSLPEAPESLLTEANFNLAHDEAEFLRERFATMPGNSLISWLARNGATAEVEYIWEHPQRADFTENMRSVVDHAERFHHIAYGAAVLYNLMLARLTQSDDLIDLYADELDLWTDELADSRALAGWEVAEFWSTVRSLNPGIRPGTELFLNKWFQHAADGTHESQAAQDLIQNREIVLKGNRSRLVNADARERWTGQSGLARLDYRWSVASRYLEDIYTGMESD
jgi:hypothetical protein